MTMIRSTSLPAHMRREHAGPCPGGTFWAFRDAHDLPGQHFIFSDPAQMLRRGILWWQDAEKPGTCAQVPGMEELNAIRRDVLASRWIDQDGFPRRTWMPEFYYVPRTWRGARLVYKAKSRSLIY